MNEFSCSGPVIILSSLKSRAGVRHLFKGVPRVGAIVLGATFVALVAVTTVPALASVFRFSTPTIGHWISAFAVGVGCLFLFELAKLLAVPNRAELSGCPPHH